LCSDCGIDGKLQHESYIASWVKVLKADKRAIFTASSAARKAADYAKKIIEVQLAA
jgi:antirestriction protein ArdC